MIVESVAVNHRQKKMGYNAAQELYNRVQKSLAKKKRSRRNEKYCFGIDIGGTTVKCGLFNVDGEVLDKWEIKTRTENNGENIIADIAETMNVKIAEKVWTKKRSSEQALVYRDRQMKKATFR